MKKPDEELGKQILNLAKRLLSLNLEPTIVERQFFFNFWCQSYLKDIQRLRKILPAEDCQYALREGGFKWLDKQRPQAARILRRLSKKYGIAWQDVLGHIIGNLPLAGYPKLEYYLPDDENMRSTEIPPGSSAIIIHSPSKKDFDRLCLILQDPKMLPPASRKPDTANYIRRCACLCLADRVNYGNRGAIRQWDRRFSKYAYCPHGIITETQAGEIYFSHQKRQLIERFKLLEAGKISYLTETS